MRNQMNSHDLTRQNEVNVKKSQKHDANLQKNSTLYFQVGLIVCLLFTYGLLEMEFSTKKFVPEMVYADLPLDVGPESFEIYKDPVVEVIEVQKHKSKLIDEIEVIDNQASESQETLDIVTPEENTTDKLIAIHKIENNISPNMIDDVPFFLVEVSPVFPGCEKAKTNDDRKACMSEKISKHIRKKFDTDIASELGLEGVQKINVIFKIDKNGNVVDIQAKSFHKALENEAKDVIGKLPKMTPGKQKDKNVSVVYGVPIKFSVQN